MPLETLSLKDVLFWKRCNPKTRCDFLPPSQTLPVLFAVGVVTVPRFCRVQTHFSLFRFQRAGGNTDRGPCLLPSAAQCGLVDKMLLSPIILLRHIFIFVVYFHFFIALADLTIPSLTFGRLMLWFLHWWLLLTEPSKTRACRRIPFLEDGSARVPLLRGQFAGGLRVVSTIQKDVSSFPCSGCCVSSLFVCVHIHNLGKKQNLWYMYIYVYFYALCPFTTCEPTCQWFKFFLKIDCS